MAQPASRTSTKAPADPDGAALPARASSASLSSCPRMTAGLPMSPRINHVGGCFDDLPEGTVGTVVVNAPSVVWAQFLQHAEADEPTEFLSQKRDL